MKKQTSLTTEARQVFVDLAHSVANALECPEIPQALAGALIECIHEITEVLEPAHGHAVSIAILRGLANAEICKARPAAEKSLTAKPGAKSGV